MDTSAITKEAGELAVDCLFAEKTHFIFSDYLRRTSFWMSLSSAIMAAVAGFGGIADVLPSVIVPWFALVAAVLGGIHTAMKPGESAKAHHQRGVAFAAQRRRLRQFIHVDCQADIQETQLVQRLHELTEQKIRLMGLQPATPSGCFYRKAKRAITAGEANYDPDEIAAAVGDWNAKP